MSRLPQAVIFDWDNTLIDSWGTIHDALNETLAAMNHPLWTIEETKARARLSLRDSFPRYFGASWEIAGRIYLEAFQRIHLQRLTPLPGAASILQALRDCDRYLAVVSNKTGRLLRAEVEALGWDGHFSRVVGAGDAHADKPHPATIERALSGSGIEAGETVWYVGDTDIDIVTARNARCTAVLLHRADEAVSDQPVDTMPQPDLEFRDFFAMSKIFTAL